MFIARTGNGTRGVVGLHGWSGDHTTFDPLLKVLPHDATFFTLDTPGCGQSPEPKKWEMRSMAREVAEEIVGFGQDNLTLVGSCSGALVAIFAVRELMEMGKQEVVGRVVMIDPFAYCPWYFQVFVRPEFGSIGWMIYLATFANPLGRWIVNLSLQDKRAAETDLTKTFSQVNHRLTWRYLKMMYECGSPDQFAGIKIPVEIVRGEKTFSAVTESVRLWSNVFPQAHLHVLPGVGHLPIDEGTTEVAKIIFSKNLDNFPTRS